MSFAQVGAGTEGNQQLNGMECIASGYGGLEDLVEALSEEKVIFGMMKFSLGDGMFARDKFVYLHFNGADCKGMKKAKDNSKKEETVKAMGGSHTEMTFERKVEVTIDDIVEHCLRVLVIDGGSYNKAQMQEKIETQMVKKETAKIGTATELGKDPSADFMDVLEQVRAEKGSFNWLLANPEPSSPSFHEAGTGSLPEMRKYLHPELVLYGLVRMAFGTALPAQFVLRPRLWPAVQAFAGLLRVQAGQVLSLIKFAVVLLRARRLGSLPEDQVGVHPLERAPHPRRQARAVEQRRRRHGQAPLQLRPLPPRDELRNPAGGHGAGAGHRADQGGHRERRRRRGPVQPRDVHGGAEGGERGGVPGAECGGHGAVEL